MCTGSPSSAHKLSRVLMVFCILRTTCRLCVRHLTWLLKRRNIGINIEIDVIYLNLVLLLLFVRNLG